MWAAWGVVRDISEADQPWCLAAHCGGTTAANAPGFGFLSGRDQNRLRWGISMELPHQTLVKRFARGQMHEVKQRGACAFSVHNRRAMCPAPRRSTVRKSMLNLDRPDSFGIA